MKIASSNLEIPRDAQLTTSVGVFVSKCDGMDALLRQISRLVQVSSGLSVSFVLGQALAAGSGWDS